jgi:lipid A 3-O-deacylase
VFSPTRGRPVTLLGALFAVVLSWPAPQESGETEQGTVRFQIANDVLTGSDDYFSNGWIVSWHSRPEARWSGLLPDGLAPLVEILPGLGTGASGKRVSFAVSQLIFTPGDIKNPDSIPEDVPYSGALLGAACFSAQDPDRMTAWQVTAGMLGPVSLAEETQQFTHEVVHAPRPAGWEHQLKDEFILNLHAQHKFKFARLAISDEWGFDVGGVASAALGSLATQVDAGFEIRAGWKMPPGFDPDPVGRKVITHGYARDAVERDFSAHAFGSAAARGWARFIFLDGNTWKDSPSVERNTWTLVLGGGVSASFRRFRFTLEFGATTRPVEGAGGFDSFGSFSVSYTY